MKYRWISVVLALITVLSVPASAILSFAEKETGAYGIDNTFANVFEASGAAKEKAGEKAANRYTVSFSVGDHYSEQLLEKGSLPLYPYGLGSTPTGGYYSVFGGFDKQPVAVRKDITYTAIIEKKRVSEVSFFSFSDGKMMKNGKATVFLTSDCAYTDFSLQLVYDRTAFSLDSVAFRYTGGSYTADTLTFSGAGQAGKVAELTFSAKTDTGRCVIDALPNVYSEGTRLPVVCENGMLTVVPYLTGDLDEDGTVSAKDAEKCLDALAKGKSEEIDFYHDEVTSVKDLTYLLNYIAGKPVHLYSKKDGETHKIRYSASLGGTVVGENEQELTAFGTSSSVVASCMSDCYRFSGWSDGFGGLRRSDADVYEDTELVAYYTPVIPQLTIPVLNIKTEYGAGVYTDGQYISATLDVTNAEEPYLCSDLEAEIRGRGNSTWQYYRFSKPSYALKLKEKNHLLGVGNGAERDFVLLTTITDKSLLRNYTALRLGRLLSKIPFASDCRFAELYLDGVYKGLYLLCEKIEIADTRINIDDKSEENERGYLIEMDARAGSGSFTVRNGQQPFAVKGESSYAQLRYVSKKVNALNKAMLAGTEKDIAAVCDIDSLVDMYILEEFTFDRDVGFSSFYFYYENETFYFCGPWDFDLALGNDGEYPGYDYLFSEGGRGNDWFKVLSREEWFVARVKERMEEVSALVELVISEAEIMGKALKEAANRNYRAYPMTEYFGIAEPWEVSAIQTYPEQVTYFAEWMKNRWQWLFNYFQNA